MKGAADGVLHGEPGSDRGLLPPPRPVQLGNRREQITQWKRFYGDLFGILTFASMVIPWGKEAEEEILIINNRITMKEIVLQHEKFTDLNIWTCNLDNMMKPVRPETEWYGACISQSIERTFGEGISLREYLLRCLKCYYYDSKVHLDQETSTVCTGAVLSNGDYPHVAICGNSIYVDRHDVLYDSCHSYFRVSVI